VVISYIFEKHKVLEVGAGAGWQSAFLEKEGFLVDAIDVETTNYNSFQTFPVKMYNGIDIPFHDDEFDVVFSSNVLEHISNVEQTQQEIIRVLKDDGVCVHILPSHYWRFWTSITHYFSLPKNLYMWFNGRKNKLENTNQRKENKPNYIKFLNALISSRHGERGNRFTEIYYFHPSWWLNNFRNNGFDVVKYQPIGLFYTGHNILGKFLSIENRKKMAKFLGSACYIYVLRKCNSTQSQINIKQS
jgi:SAM-dependent methyltransferase